MIKILFFAQLRERLDCSALELAIDKPLAVSELCKHLATQGDRWLECMQDSKLLAAVNQTMVGFDTQVKPGDEVAFFPPVTGG